VDALPLASKYTGVTPTIAFTDPAGNVMREIHKSQSNCQNWDWAGTAGSASIAWATHGATADAYA
jgi:hypothetical protein